MTILSNAVTWSPRSKAGESLTGSDAENVRRTMKVSDGGGSRHPIPRKESARRHSLHWLCSARLLSSGQKMLRKLDTDPQEESPGRSCKSKV